MLSTFFSYVDNFNINLSTDTKCLIAALLFTACLLILKSNKTNIDGL